MPGGCGDIFVTELLWHNLSPTNDGFSLKNHQPAWLAVERSVSTEKVDILLLRTRLLCFQRPVIFPEQ